MSSPPRNNRPPSAFLAAVFLIILTAEPAVAYIDPGQGSLFFQYLIGLVLGALIFVRGAIQRSLSGILRKLRRVFRREG